jgi:hypothetical protein
MVIPEVAHAAGSDLSPSLQNFLLSIFAGGAVLAAIFGAVIGFEKESNLDILNQIDETILKLVIKIT